MAADLLISLHADSNPDPCVNGLSIYTLNDGRSDREAAALARRENQSDVIAGVDLSGGNSPVAPILIDLAQRDTINKSSRFAQTALAQLAGATDILPRSPHRSASLAVLVAPDVPAVLIELGYLSNRVDAAQMNTDRWRAGVAKAIADAVDRNFAPPRAAGRGRRIAAAKSRALILPLFRRHKPAIKASAMRAIKDTDVSPPADLCRAWRRRAGRVGVLAAAFYIYSVTRDLPSVEALQNYSRRSPRASMPATAPCWANMPASGASSCPSPSFPSWSTQAFTSAEDRNFYSHPGIDPSGIMRAAIKDVVQRPAGKPA